MNTLNKVNKKKMKRSDKKVLMFFPAIAPYRIDLFNNLFRVLDLHISFLNRTSFYHPGLDYPKLLGSLEGEHSFIDSGWIIKNRNVQPEVWSVISRKKPDVVVVLEYSLSTLVSLLYRKLHFGRGPGVIILTAENPSLLESRTGVMGALTRFCCKEADSMLVYTEDMRDAVVEKFGVNKDKIFICANLHEETSYRARLESAGSVINETIEKYQLHNKKVVLYTGRMIDIKGVDGAINSFANISEKHPDSVLVLAGSGADEAKLKTLAKERGVEDRVLFVGYVSGNELLVWYRLAGLFVLNSHYEPYGAVIHESLLGGVPVICSAKSGGKVLIKENHNGTVVDSTDSKTLDQAMDQLVQSAQTVDEIGTGLRDSLMIVSFQRDIDSFVDAVEFAATGSTTSKASDDTEMSKTET